MLSDRMLQSTLSHDMRVPGKTRDADRQGVVDEDVKKTNKA